MTALNAKERAQWMLHRLAGTKGICNLTFALRVDQTLRWWPLRAAFDHLLRRHPALRTVVQTVGPDVRKRVLAEGESEINIDMVTGHEDDLAAQLRVLVAEPFDMGHGPLIRAHMVTLPASTVVCVVVHHLVADAVSVQVLMRELAELYDAFADGRDLPAELSGAGATYDEPPPNDVTMAYWAQRLDGVQPGSQAVADARPLASRPTFAGDHIDRVLSPEIVTAVGRLRARTRSTDNIVLLAAFYFLLAQHGAGPDLVVGIPTNGRRGAAADAVGFHVNTLPVRVRVDLDRTFDDLVRDTRDAFLGDLEHGTASFETIHHQLGSRSADWRVPLFRHSFNVRPAELTGLTMARQPIRTVPVHCGLSRLDLELLVWVGPGTLDVTAVFSTEVHDRATIERMLARFEAMLSQLDARPDAPLHTIDPFTAEDWAIIESVNNTFVEWPPGTVLDLVRTTGTARPDTEAVEGRCYRDLLNVAAGVRAELVRRGVLPGEVVGLYVDRGFSLAAAVLGVWAAGAAYLPLDPAHPASRIAFQLNDAGVRTVLANRPVPAEVDVDVAALDDIPPGVATDVDWTPGPTAYVIYTSGSTGQPKGVEVGHAALTNLVRYFHASLEISEHDRVLWLTTFSFDISALELLVPLVAGARVIVVPAELRLDPAALGRFLAVRRITVAQATPTTWRQLIPHLNEHEAGLRVVCGGEPLTAELAEDLLSTGARVFNAYGPTETTIWSTVAELSSPVPERVPIGLPIANTVVRVLDPRGRPVPPGLQGELSIGGAGLAEGYRGDQARTDDVFRSDPTYGRHYRTGDLVRQRLDGQLEFLGRNDRQVKVRGHRVEPAEIEAALARHIWVTAVAVLTDQDPNGHFRLTAAVLPADLDAGARSMFTATLREHAAQVLPTAMVPSRFVVVSEFPLTGNGKVDYGALAGVVSAANEPVPELPTEPVLRTIVESWRAVLGDDRLSVDSNFFLSGGHSLAAIELAGQISARTGREIGFDVIFDAPTPWQLVDLLAGREVAE
ncbi:non-ribosomal peptide synthetase [Kibdelosporangium aridum]|uniref:non-ribosomal peptide synthetase n=1 Tax=Kibdelosporangium aridum TaxID=2030 RepID=UPI000525D32F